MGGGGVLDPERVGGMGVEGEGEECECDHSSFLRGQ